MRIVVDTNIIFISILNPNGLIGELLFNTGRQFQQLNSLNEQNKRTSINDMLNEQVELFVSQRNRNVTGRNAIVDRSNRNVTGRNAIVSRSGYYADTKKQQSVKHH